MAIDLITELPLAPTIGDPDFSPKMYNLAAAMRTMGIEYNASNVQLNTIYLDIINKHETIVDAYTFAQQAESFSIAASNSAIAAETAATTAAEDTISSITTTMQDYVDSASNSATAAETAATTAAEDTISSITTAMQTYVSDAAASESLARDYAEADPDQIVETIESEDFYSARHYAYYAEVSKDEAWTYMTNTINAANNVTVGEVLRVSTFVASEGQSVFPVQHSSENVVLVYLNGYLLPQTDYASTDNYNSVTLSEPANAGQDVLIHIYNRIKLVDALTVFDINERVASYEDSLTDII